MINKSSEIKWIFAVAIFLHASICMSQTGKMVFFRSELYKDKLTDGLITDAVVSGTDPVYVAVGSSVYDSNATGWIRDRGRFVRVAPNGSPQANLLYSIFNSSNQEQRSELLSIAERVNTNTMTSTTEPAFVLSGSVGNTQLTSPGTNVLILPVNVSGAPLVPKSIDLGGNDVARCTRQSKRSPDVFYTCGSISGFASNIPTQGFIIKHNASASTLSWVKKFTIPTPYTSQTEVVSLAEEPNTGNIVVVGNTSIFLPSNTQISSISCLPNNISFPFIAKFNASGTLIWSRVYDHLLRNFLFTEIRPTNVNQEFIITGSVGSKCGNNDKNLVLIRVNTSASTGPNIIFSTEMTQILMTFGTEYNYKAEDAVTVVDSTGALSYYVCGTNTNTTSTGSNSDGFIIKAGPTGQFQSMTRFKQGSKNEGLLTIDQVRKTNFSGNGLAAFGFQEINLANLASPTNPKGWLVKTDFNLISACTDLPDSVRNINLNFFESIINPVFSTTSNTSTNLTCTTTNMISSQLCWSISINRPDPATTDRLSIMVVPNPVSGSKATLLIESVLEEEASIVVTNTFHQAVQKSNWLIGRGSNRRELDLSGLSAGVYMIQLTTASGLIKSVRFVKAG